MPKRFICHCGIYCKVPTEVSKSTYYSHLRLEEASKAPSFTPATTSLTAAFADAAMSAAHAHEEHNAKKRQREVAARTVSEALVDPADDSHPSTKRTRVDTVPATLAVRTPQDPLPSYDVGSSEVSLTGSARNVGPDATFGSSMDLQPATLHGPPSVLPHLQPPRSEPVVPSAFSPAFPNQSMPEETTDEIEDDEVPEEADEHGSDREPDRSGDHRALPSESHDVPPTAHIEDLKVAQQFIDAIKAATLDNTGLHEDVLSRIRNPPQEVLDLGDNPSLALSLDVYLHCDRAAEHIYHSFRAALSRYPNNIQLMPLEQIKKRAQEISGVYPMFRDMCINSCVGFVGPFAELHRCPECGEDRYESQPLQSRVKKLKPRKQFLTNPLGPQIQAAWRSPESAEAMSYRKQCMERVLDEVLADGTHIPQYSDWLHGSEAVEATQRGHITPTSSVLMLSLDGAQLYRSKQSDCWIYIWVLLDKSPDSRYKKQHVLIGGVIPGPKKPKNVDSFLFPGIAHLSALMREGLLVWDASTRSVFCSKPFLAYVTADGPGMQFVNGLVGHSGRFGCRLYCPVRGRHKPGGGHYYPACLKPLNYAVPESSHADVSLRPVSLRPQDAAAARYAENLRYVQESRNLTQYERRRLETGIAKPSVLSSLPSDCMFGIPNMFPADLMHLVSLNIPDLLLGLWRATLKNDASDPKSSWNWAVFENAEVWKKHGAQVAQATPYLPGCFDRPPRNPAEKLNSGYKAVEFLTYIFGLAPALLYGVLPFKYWQNFCRLVRGIRLIYQHKVTPAQLREAHKQLILFTEEFEALYYQRRTARLHFVRQSIHALSHIAPETARIGPYANLSQFTMERAIGDLGGEIRQPSKPYANLAQRALRRCQVNAIKHMLPEFSPAPQLPRGSVPLDNNYLLLPKIDARARDLPGPEANALRQFICTTDIDTDVEWLASPKVIKWARLRLPNKQTARCAWTEKTRPLTQIRASRNIKLCRQARKTEFGEVQYFFKLDTPEGPRACAMVSLYSDPDAELLEQSWDTLWSCTHTDQLIVVDVAAIQSVVAVVPHPILLDASRDSFRSRYFIVEKLGLDVMTMLGLVEIEDGHEDENGNE